MQNGSKDKTTTVSYTTPTVYSTPTISRDDLVVELDKACTGIEQLNVCSSHQVWVEVGCALAKELGEQGRAYFHRLSQGYPTYSTEETNCKYDELLQHADRYNYNRGTIFHHIKEAHKV